MVAPCMILYLAIIAGPILASLGIAFTDNDFRPNQQWGFIGFDNFIKIFSDDVFWKGLKNNMLVVALSVFGQIPLGLLLAYFLFRNMVKGSGFFQAMVFMPQVISTVVIGRIFQSFFDIRGAATGIVRAITNNPDFTFRWFIEPGQAMIPILIGMLFIYTGFYMLMFLANMQKMDSGIVEAAAIDGANEMQIFARIIAPALSGIIIVNAILAIAGSLKSFDLIYAMAPNDGKGLGNNNIVLATYMYFRGFKVYKMAFGSAVSVVIVTISLLLIAISNWAGKKLDPLQEG
ncbi:MAG: sugar ABC transporter permease [Spirochaetales bacterium]|nr:sugar ABC transporter permease [Spirochaetales bacterium]